MPLRSVYSDPIAAGIKAFGDVSETLNRRELTAQTIADRRLHAEGEEQRQKAVEEDRVYIKKIQQQHLQENFDKNMTGDLLSAHNKLTNGEPLNDQEELAYLAASNRALNFKDKTPKEITEITKNIRVLHEGIQKIFPDVQKAIQAGGGYIERSSAPDLFNAFDSVPTYGADIDKGTDRHGSEEGVKKSLDRIYITKEGTMIPYLRVEDSKGQVYYAPATAGRSGDPNAAVLQLPVQLFGAHVESQVGMAKNIESILMKYGHGEFAKKRKAAGEVATRSETYLIGERAVMTALADNPRTDVNTLRNAYKTSVREAAKEKGIAIPEKEIDEGAKSYIPEKQPRAMGSPAGREIEDRARIVAEYGEDSPEVKRFDDGAAALHEKADKNPTEASLALKAARGDKTAQKALDILRAEKKSAKEDKGPSDSTIDRRLKEADRLLFGRYKGKKDPEVADLDTLLNTAEPEAAAEIQRKREEIANLIEKDHLTAQDAVNKVVGKAGKTDTLKPMTPESGKKFEEQVRKEKPKTREEAWRRYSEIAKKAGYNPGPEPGSKK
jgi:hypothetical protein